MCDILPMAGPRAKRDNNLKLGVEVGGEGGQGVLNAYRIHLTVFKVFKVSVISFCALLSIDI